MKKLLIYLGIVVILFGGLYFVNQQSSKSSDKGYAYNPYGVSVSKLHPETVKQLNDPNYQNVILPTDLDKRLKNKESFFQYYYSSTCPHCKVTTPVLVPIEKELGIDVKQFNLEEFKDGWQKYKIDSTPTLVYYKDGVEVERIVGGVPESATSGGNKPETFKAFFQKYKG
ncbi:thioredoxin family protein [Paenibacillus sp. SYP-B3998]|uniref:Thioredoxin family protein n=1 Tax=Paenibacillus sp. SYP-B3998 TaxID=2678564 RepID=A0A6G4A332_9BACL|nr:thioredoxin family protein [Paenibacillus sp. SYP-B3998]NEW08698.1 thioredoxin family protein [Paenibacillus sp. SYP-B3998]